MLIDCNNCKAVIQTEVIGSYTNNNPYDPLDAKRYTFNKCPQCFSPILVEEELVYNGVDMEWANLKRLYPNNLFHVNPIIPEQLRNALFECIQCYKADANTATVIMCRRTIEGFCLLKGITENNLGKSIKKLRDDGYINDQLYEWADELRLAGNEAAHNIDNEFSSIDSKDILDFTIAILDFTYSFKDKFDKFKARTNKRNE